MLSLSFESFNFKFSKLHVSTWNWLCLSHRGMDHCVASPLGAWSIYTRQVTFKNGSRCSEACRTPIFLMNFQHWHYKTNWNFYVEPKRQSLNYMLSNFFPESNNTLQQYGGICVLSLCFMHPSLFSLFFPSIYSSVHFSWAFSWALSNLKWDF